WRLFLKRLSPGGVLSFSRWYSSEFPGETYRIVSLAAAALKAEGITEPRKHLVLISNVRPDFGAGVLGAATILVRKEPFSDQEIDMLELLSKQMHFNVMFSPRIALNEMFSSLAKGDLNANAVRSQPL